MLNLLRTWGAAGAIWCAVVCLGVAFVFVGCVDNTATDAENYPIAEYLGKDGIAVPSDLKVIAFMRDTQRTEWKAWLCMSNKEWRTIDQSGVVELDVDRPLQLVNRELKSLGMRPVKAVSEFCKINNRDGKGVQWTIISFECEDGWFYRVEAISYEVQDSK